MKLLRKQFIFKANSFDDANYIVRGVFSDGNEDRQGEVVDQAGWKLDEYMANPVVLFAHDHWQPAIGKMIELAVNPQGQLAGAIQFAAEEYDFARTIYNLYKGGFMRAFSVGFENLVYEIDQEKDVVMLKENKLYEVSCVNVPANAMALAMQKGIDMSSVLAAKKKAIENENREEKKDEKKKDEKSPACRMDGETKDECVARKIPEIKKEDPEMSQEQAVAIAESVCGKACSDKAIEVISRSNMETILKAIEILTKISKASGTDNQVDEGRQLRSIADGKKVSVKLINRAVRQLLKVKKSI